MIWRVVHWLAAVQWGFFLFVMLIEIFRHGDLPRAAAPAGHFETSFIMWMTALLILTVASAMRGAWLECEA